MTSANTIREVAVTLVSTLTLAGVAGAGPVNTAKDAKNDGPLKKRDND